jgi:hypothetical protein
MAPTNTIDTTPGTDPENRPLVISLSVVLPVVALCIVAGLVAWCRVRRRRPDCGSGGAAGGGGFFSRNVSPVDDDEIESWKTSHIEKKATAATQASDWTYGGDVNSIAKYPAADAPGTPRPALPRITPIQTSTIAHHASNGSIGKPPSLIVYQTPRASEDDYGCSPSLSPAPHSAAAAAWPPSHKHSVDLAAAVQTPVLARAPNARPGLTDESSRGDVPYVIPPSSSSHGSHHRRQSSRLTKHASSPRSPKYHLNHHRNCSSRSTASSSSLRQWYGQTSSPAAAAVVMPPRASTDGGGSSSNSGGGGGGPNSITPTYYTASPTTMSPLATSAESAFSFEQPKSPIAAATREYRHHHHHRHHQRSGSVPGDDSSHRPSLDVNFAFGRAPGVRPEDIGRAIG